MPDVPETNYVAQADWDHWEAERLAANERYHARRRHERARPVKPTMEEVLAQMRVLREHNEELTDRLARCKEIALAASVLDAELISALLADQPRRLRIAA